ncbi:MAG: formylglycine-generating enzyme family protein [Cyanobacteria bacterium P01_F01_bin.53]
MASSSQLTINTRQGQNQHYKEPIAKECHPLEMMHIPAGSFIMGSPEDELDRETNEGPQHEVTLSQFFMARYPITQAQWRAVAAMPQVKRELKSAPSRFKGERLPVEQVSWYDTVEFCDRLTIHTNRQYRLPTEAEWEYACRAGTTTPFHFGDTITTEIANYDGRYTYADGHKGEYRRRTTPVDEFDIANAYGLCDMHGNVWEWCQDQYSSYDQRPTNGIVWITNDQSPYILRGGSWVSYPRNCRSAFRSDDTPSNTHFSIGFRVSCSASKT